MNGRAAKAKRQRRRQEYHSDVAVLMAWCLTEEDIPDARQRTHDGLIAMMGDERTGGVTWRWWTGEAALDVLERAMPDASPELADYYRRMRGLLREQGGYIVMASAPGRRR